MIARGSYAPMGFYAGPPPVDECGSKFTASNGFVIERAPILEACIHKALDKSEVNSAEYWAWIEYLAWHKERFTLKSGRPARFD